MTDATCKSCPCDDALRRRAELAEHACRDAFRLALQENWDGVFELLSYHSPEAIIHKRRGKVHTEDPRRAHGQREPHEYAPDQDDTDAQMRYDHNEGGGWRD